VTHASDGQIASVAYDILVNGVRGQRDTEEVVASRVLGAHITVLQATRAQVKVYDYLLAMVKAPEAMEILTLALHALVPWPDHTLAATITHDSAVDDRLACDCRRGCLLDGHTCNGATRARSGLHIAGLTGALRCCRRSLDSSLPNGNVERRRGDTVEIAKEG
jgi:hypothetical protein